MLFRIIKLELKNVRNIKNGSIYLNEYDDILNGDINDISHRLGIFGPNGSGKSTVLMSIHYIINLIVGRENRYSLLQQGKDQFSISTTFYIENEKDDGYLIEYEYTYNSNNRIVERLIIHGYDYENECFGGISMYEHTGDSSEVFKNFKDDAILTLYKLAKYKFGIYTPAYEKVPYYLWGFDREPQMLKQGNYNDDLKFIIDRVNTVLYDLVGVKVKIANNCGLLFTYFEHDGYSIQYSDESVGIRKLVGLLLYIIPLSVNSDICLLVDEIENSLFDQLVLVLLDSVNKAESGQIIFTSHQFSLINPLSTGAIFFAEDNEYKVLRGIPLERVYQEHLRERLPEYYRSTDLKIKIQEAGRRHE